MTQADENITGVTGAHTTDGLPHGVTSLTPFIAIRGAAEAIEFYQNVFGARLIDKTEFGGVIVHADIDFGTATAKTNYGTCGVKVWIFKGEILAHDPMAQDKRAAEQAPQR